MPIQHYVERHQIDKNWVQEEYDDDREYLAELVAHLRERSDCLAGVAETAADCFALGCVASPGARELLDWARLASRAQAAIIAFAGDETAAQPIAVDGETILVKPFATPVNALDWIAAFSLALIARDAETTARLAETQGWALRKTAVQMDGYHFIRVAMLQSWRCGRDIANHLIDYGRLTEPSAVKIAVPEVVRRTTLLTEALKDLVANDADGFNAHLAAAVEAHKGWWSRRDRDNDLSGFVAVEALALACAAHDSGMEITVESDYIPAALITRTFMDD